DASMARKRWTGEISAPAARRAWGEAPGGIPKRGSAESDMRARPRRSPGTCFTRAEETRNRGGPLPALAARASGQGRAGGVAVEAAGGERHGDGGAEVGRAAVGPSASQGGLEVGRNAQRPVGVVDHPRTVVGLA